MLELNYDPSWLVRSVERPDFGGCFFFFQPGDVKLFNKVKTLEQNLSIVLPQLEYQQLNIFKKRFTE